MADRAWRVLGEGAKMEWLRLYIDVLADKPMTKITVRWSET